MWTTTLQLGELVDTALRVSWLDLDCENKLLTCRITILPRHVCSYHQPL
jgi:hypothetical protein